MNPINGQLQTKWLQTLDADPPIDETAPSTDDVKEAVAKLRSGKAAGIYDISVKLLKGEGEAMIRGNAVLTAGWHSGTNSQWKKASFLFGKGKETVRTLTSTPV